MLSVTMTDSDGSICTVTGSSLHSLAASVGERMKLKWTASPEKSAIFGEKSADAVDAEVKLYQKIDAIHAAHALAAE